MKANSPQNARSPGAHGGAASAQRDVVALKKTFIGQLNDAAAMVRNFTGWMTGARPVPSSEPLPNAAPVPQATTSKLYGNAVREQPASVLAADLEKAKATLADLTAQPLSPEKRSEVMTRLGQTRYSASALVRAATTQGPLNAAEQEQVMALLAQHQAAARTLDGLPSIAMSTPTVGTLSVSTSGEPIPFARQLNGIVSLFGDRQRSFDTIRSLERDVVARAMRDGLSLDDARHVEFQENEVANGFPPGLDSIEHAVTKEEFVALLSRGRMFLDAAFGYGDHGIESHRVQWQMVMRAMRDDPAAFGLRRVDRDGKAVLLLPDGKEFRAHDMFVSLGFDPATGAGSRASQSIMMDGEEITVWAGVFDTTANANFTRPDTVSRERSYMGLGNFP